MSETQPLDFKTFATVAGEIESTGSRLQKAELLSELLADAGPAVGIAARFMRGDIFPAWSDMKASVGNATIYDALALASGTSADEVETLVAEVGDPGEVCLQLDLSPETGQVTLGGQTNSHTVESVFKDFEAIATVSGSGSQSEKVERIKRLLLDADGVEAKYIVRLLLNKMRIGVGSGVVRDAISTAFEVDVELVERGLMVTNDVDVVATTARAGGNAALGELSIDIGRPVKPMLASKGVKSDAVADAGSSSGEVVVEWKYDGARLQCHVTPDSVRLFSRSMNEVTESMPDVCSLLREQTTVERAIIDCEVVAYTEDSDEPEPFQEVMKRFKRKYDIEEMAEKIRLSIYSFDILYAEGESLIDSDIRSRRERLEQAVSDDILAPQWLVSTADEIARLEERSLESGHEGVMVKNPDSTYQPDNRGKNWLKIKPAVETLDCVVVGAEWGEGRRSHLLGTFMLAVREADTGELKRIGKVGTGLSDAKLAELTERLKPRIETESGKQVTVTPDIVFEVGTEEIQPSPTYESGYGLRFPRFIEIREDKGVEDIETVERVTALYESQ